MHFTANVVIKLQNFSGDASGGLFGNFGTYATATSAMAMGNVSVQTRVVEGEDPITTLYNALAARQDMPELTLVNSPAPAPLPTPPLP